MCRIELDGAWYLAEDDNTVYVASTGGSKMTLALALAGRDGIVMATDSRKTYVDNRGRIMRAVITRKLYPLGNYTGLAIESEQSGQAEWMVRQFSADAHALYDETVKAFVECVSGIWGAFTKNMPPSLLRDKSAQTIYILCGYDALGNPSIIQSVSTDTPNVFMPNIFDGYCTVGLSDEANYWMKRIEHDGVDIRCAGLLTLQRLCAFLLKETIERYPELVGEPIQMLTITKEDGVRTITEDELLELNSIASSLSNTSKVLEMLKEGLK